MKKGNKYIYLYFFLAVVILFIFFVDKNRAEGAVKEETVVIEVDNSLYEKESKTIKKYENYIVPTRPSIDEESYIYSQIMFSNKKVTIADLKERDKMYVVLAYLEKDGFFEEKTYYQIYDDEGKELEHPKKISEKKYNPQREDKIVYKKINANKIQKISNKIFATDIEIPKHIVYNNKIECTYDEKIECSSYKGNTIVSENYVKYVSSDLKNDEIHIYQKYLHQTHLNGLSPLDNGLEGIDMNENSIKEITNGVIDKYGTTYKTTFKKGDDDKYYWYSTEPVEKNTK